MTSVPDSAECLRKEMGVNRTLPLSAEDERDLAFRIINEDCAESRERFIRANLYLVTAISKKYARRGLSPNDLMEEGKIGLRRAVDEFDPAQGTRFSTYASWWIKQAIKRASMPVGKLPTDGRGERFSSSV